jgi:hypothetical protein
MRVIDQQHRYRQAHEAAEHDGPLGDGAVPLSALTAVD